MGDFIKSLASTINELERSVNFSISEKLARDGVWNEELDNTLLLNSNLSENNLNKYQSFLANYFIGIGIVSEVFFSPEHNYPAETFDEMVHGMHYGIKGIENIIYGISIIRKNKVNLNRFVKRRALNLIENLENIEINQLPENPTLKQLITYQIKSDQIELNSINQCINSMSNFGNQINYQLLKINGIYTPENYITPNIVEEYEIVRTIFKNIK
jgi:hypothetical protein